LSKQPAKVLSQWKHKNLFDRPVCLVSLIVLAAPSRLADQLRELSAGMRKLGRKPTVTVAVR
jgi:hypothetical protein